MRYAGIAWTGRGFDVAVRDDSGEAGPIVHLPVVADVTAHLRELDRAAGADLVCVVESTNGMVDGGLMAAGLRVHRADPWTLPDRPEFGSVDADTLALTAAARPTELTPLVLESGSLTGREADAVRTSAASEAELASLVAAGRCLDSGPRDDSRPAVALTFDDGPNPPFTGRVLDVLERYGVPATFFCVGLHAGAHADELARM